MLSASPSLLPLLLTVSPNKHATSLRGYRGRKALSVTRYYAQPLQVAMEESRPPLPALNAANPNLTAAAAAAHFTK
jgi:hypothetical protein